MNRIAIYPRTRGRVDPFLSHVSKAFRASEWVVSHWLCIFFPVRRPQVLLLNWAENLWDRTDCSRMRKGIRNLKRLTLLRAISRVQKSGATVIMVAHNLHPHGNKSGPDFWASSGLELTRSVDLLYHLNPASEEIFKGLLPDVPHHISALFPVESAQPRVPQFTSKKISRLLLFGVNQERKNLKELLSLDFAVAKVDILATGYTSSQNFAKHNPNPGPGISPAVKWAGARASQKALRDLLMPGSALVLNQWDQLNSGLMWLALSRGIPVIAPATEPNRAILKEVGGFLLRLFNSSLDAETTVKLLRTTNANRKSSIDWDKHSFATFASNIQNFIARN